MIKAQDTSTIMRNPPYIVQTKIVLVSLIVLLRGFPCFHDFSHGASLHPYSNDFYTCIYVHVYCTSIHAVCVSIHVYMYMYMCVLATYMYMYIVPLRWDHGHGLVLETGRRRLVTEVTAHQLQQHRDLTVTSMISCACLAAARTQTMQCTGVQSYKNNRQMYDYYFYTIFTCTKQFKANRCMYACV